LNDEEEIILSTQWIETIKKEMEEYRELMLKAERYLWAHPQTGFKEWDAHNYLKEKFVEMGFCLKEAGNIPGFYFDIDSGVAGPTVCLLGELDSIICFEHPECNPETGAVHSCGHHCQVSALLGIAGVLSKKNILSQLVGKIRIMAVPAEELLEISDRVRMAENGVIKYLGGKTEFMSRGYFDDVDITIMVHTLPGEKPYLHMHQGFNGMIAKKITYKGKAAHAAAQPWNGINALYAAQTGMSAINALRETFPDQYHVRFHPIITQGGVMVNNIPSETVIETQLRGADFPALRGINQRINRAFGSSALAFGAQLEVSDLEIYMPEKNDNGLNELLYKVGCELIGKEHVRHDPDFWDCASTDMGNISAVMPAAHPFISGAGGRPHGDNYYISNPDLAVVQPALLLSGVACELLGNDAVRAKEIIENYEPLFDSIPEFLSAFDEICVTRELVSYTDETEAIVRW